FTVVNSPLGEPPNTVNNKLLLNIITYEEVRKNEENICSVSGNIFLGFDPKRLQKEGSCATSRRANSTDRRNGTDRASTDRKNSPS
ncbi:MAG: hypothetical protein COS11_05330, partial [bacterium (Candidatus Ratteibacteria) CG01_land_8_20_14_3_00_40_19]